MHARGAFAAFAVVALLTVSACAGHESAASPTTLPAAATVAPTQTTVPEQGAFLTREPGVLTVGAESITSPWYVGHSARDVSMGFEYDLAKVIAARLGIPKVKIVDANLVTMMTAPRDCPCDLMLSQVTATDNRAKQLDISEPYLTVDQGVVVRKGTALGSVADGRTLRWATAVRDATGLDVVMKQVQPIFPVQHDVDPATAVRDLVAGNVDAVVMDAPDAMAVARTTPGLEVAGRFPTAEQYTAVLGLGSSNTVLLNDVVRAARDDGTVARLLQRYFGANPADLPVIR
jgi:ABC-type amino acid transport substrate-binding protein